jgi:hypothetical protein
MTAINRTPQNTNILQASKFILSFSRLPTVQYFCQQANVPGVTLGNAVFNTPLLDVSVAGEKLTYDEFEVTFLLDEEVQSWNELYKWLLAIASPKSIAERQSLNNLQNTNNNAINYYSDASLTIMSALNNPTLRVNFQRMFPVSLSPINFDTQNSADTILTATAKFRYAYFELTNA